MNALAAALLATVFILWLLYTQRNALLAFALPFIRDGLSRRFGIRRGPRTAVLEPGFRLFLEGIEAPLGREGLLELRSLRLSGIREFLTNRDASRLQVERADGIARASVAGWNVEIPFRFDRLAERPIPATQNGSLEIRDARIFRAGGNAPAVAPIDVDGPLQFRLGWSDSDKQELAAPDLAAGLLALTTPSSKLRLELRVGATAELTGSKLTGSLSFEDALALGIFATDFKPLPGGELALQTELAGPMTAPTLHGNAFAPQLELAMGPANAFPVYSGSDAAVCFELKPTRLEWRDFTVRAFGGKLAGCGFVELGVAGSGHGAELSWSQVRLEQLPTGASGARGLASLLRASASGAVHLRGTTGALDRLTGTGELLLSEPDYLLVRRATETLAGYGLPLPRSRGTGTCRCAVTLAGERIELSAIRGNLEGIGFDGELAFTWAGSVDGTIRVHLESSYLSRSTMLALMAMAGSVTIPILVRGSVSQPIVSADVAAALDRFVDSTPVGDALSRAQDELWNLLDGPGLRPGQDLDRVFERILSESPDAEDLLERLSASGMSAEQLRDLLADYRRRRGRRT
ncbi:MAG: hypothetical protein HY303_07145 [Candidatus Wallbacteria bacterium]|nr:hypothetical protein [Candidatus Wallbacteria bacterium]